MQQRTKSPFGLLSERYYERYDATHQNGSAIHKATQDELAQIAHHVNELAEHIGYETDAMFVNQHNATWRQLIECGVNPRELAHLMTKLVLDLAFDPVYRGEAELPEEFIVQFKQIFLHLGYTLQERP